MSIVANENTPIIKEEKYADIIGLREDYAQGNGC